MDGRPRFIHITPGNNHDSTAVHELIDFLPGRVCLADSAYDANWIIDELSIRDIKPVIPCLPVRKRKRRLNKNLYKKRYLIECCFHTLKRFRRIATRFDKTIASYAAFVHIAAAMTWIVLGTPPSLS